MRRVGGHGWRAALSRCGLAVALVLATSARAHPQAAVPEYEIKAAFLYNFAKFVEWPEDAFAASDGALVVGVLGDDPFGSLLERSLAGKTVHDHPLVIRRFARIADVQRQQCHLMFAALADARELQSAVRALGGRPVLIVGDSEGFIERGGMIGFVMDDQKLRFEVNLDAVEAANLRVSSQLLKLAARILKREQ